MQGFDMTIYVFLKFLLMRGICASKRREKIKIAHNGKSICEERGISEKFKFKQDF